MRRFYREKDEGSKVVDDETFLPRIHTDLTNEDKKVKVPPMF
jgi:hypothetical protein